MNATKAVKRSTLDIQAEGLNELNTFTLQLISLLLPQVEKLMGKKIVLSDGRSKAKAFQVDKVDKPDYTEEEGKRISYMYWWDLSDYSAWLHVKICLRGGSYEDNTYYCEYFEQAIYIGEIKGQELVRVSVREELIKDYNLAQNYTAEGLRQIVSLYTQLKDQVDKTWYLIPESVRKAEYLRH
jgi:hypothetical protein